MPSKKTLPQKRSGLPLKLDYTRAFAKDWASHMRSGRYDMGLLKQVVLQLVANDGPLGAEWRDHTLVGDWQGHRECHIGGDFLLIYRRDDDLLVLVRVGTHSELFKR